MFNCHIHFNSYARAHTNQNADQPQQRNEDQIKRDEETEEPTHNGHVPLFHETGHKVLRVQID